MPRLITCSLCERRLRVPDELLGREVKCPSCGSEFTADAEKTSIVSDGGEHVQSAPPHLANLGEEGNQTFPWQRQPAHDGRVRDRPMDESQEEVTRSPLRSRARYFDDREEARA